MRQELKVTGIERDTNLKGQELKEPGIGWLELHSQGRNLEGRRATLVDCCYEN